VAYFTPVLVYCAKKNLATPSQRECTILAETFHGLKKLGNDFGRKNVRFDGSL
jgi:hypothetical protein